MTLIDYELHHRRALAMRRRAIRMFPRRFALALRRAWAGAARPAGGSIARRPVAT